MKNRLINASPARTVDVTKGLPPLRAKWIRDRGDVEEIEGRAVKPIDDGYLSETHAAHADRKRRTWVLLRGPRLKSQGECDRAENSDAGRDLSY
jgi:ThiC-associated domain